MAKYKRTVRGGRLVASVLYTRPQAGESKRVRAAKSKATTAARKALNLKHARQRLEFVIAENFNGRDHHIVFTFDEAHLPKDRAGVIRCFKRFIRLLRAYRRAHGLPEVKYIYVIEGKHGEQRFHIHALINAAESFERDLEIYCSLWEFGAQVDVNNLYDRENKNAAVLARYLTKEREDGTTSAVGSRSWTGSKNLRQPQTECEFVRDDAVLIAPVGCYVLERREETNEFGSFAYIKYLLPDKPKSSSARKRKQKQE